MFETPSSGPFRGPTSDRRFTVILLATVVMLCAIAWHNRFLQDDAFISFRYADNLAHGHGLVYNPGERVEGYTNFLWVAIMTLPAALGLDVPLASQLAGIALFALALVFTYFLGRLLKLDKTYSLLAVVLAGANYSFSCYATGGLETMLQALLFTVMFCSVLAYWRSPRSPLLLSLSLTGAAAFLTRMDSALIVGLTFAAVAPAIWRRKARRIANLALLAVPALLIAGAWLAWKVGYYGSILPNTYYVKVSGMDLKLLKSGLSYVWAFAQNYQLFVFAALLIVTARRWVCDPALRLLMAALALWTAYVIRVGGDFMEFRMLVPLMPAFFALCAALIATVAVQRVMKAALVIAVITASILFSRVVDWGRYGQESIAQLDGRLHDRDQDWTGIGRVLGDAFRGDTGILIASSAIGAIPYYSGLRTIDMLGLTDPWVARHGTAIRVKVGHSRAAPVEYLRSRKVAIVLGPARLVQAGDSSYTWADVAPAWFCRQTVDTALLRGCQVVEIPVNAEFKLPALLLTGSGLVDSTADRKGWRRIPIAGLLQRCGTRTTTKSW